MKQPILLQGAMDVEVDELIAALGPCEETQLGGYRFFAGTVGETPVVVCKTEIGLVNAACATALGISQFQPSLVLNQGTAGGHVPNLAVGDVVIGASSVNINCLEMPVRGKGAGADPFTWQFSGFACQDAFSADEKWVERLSAAPYHCGGKYVGILGSGDLFSREYDRIRWLHAQKGELCEDMESVAVYEVCQRLHTPCVGVRIISNNELTGAPFQAQVAAELQRFLLAVLGRL